MTKLKDAFTDKVVITQEDFHINCSLNCMSTTYLVGMWHVSGGLLLLCDSLALPFIKTSLELFESYGTNLEKC